MSWVQQGRLVEGMFLRPQHFQQQDRYHEWLLEARTRALGGHFWGLLQFEARRGGAADRPGGARQGQRCAADMARRSTFRHTQPRQRWTSSRAAQCGRHLALPLRQRGRDGRPDLPQSELAHSARPTEEVLDSTGTGSATERSSRTAATAADSQTAGGDGHVRIGVVRVAERRADNVLVLDRGYIPPCCAVQRRPCSQAGCRRSGDCSRSAAGARGPAGQPGSGGLGNR